MSTKIATSKNIKPVTPTDKLLSQIALKELQEDHVYAECLEQQILEAQEMKQYYE